jgi:hypothetical protein
MEPLEVTRYRFSRANPHAPPDRRYKTARMCSAHGVLPSFRRDDRPTWDLWKFMKKRAAAQDPKQRFRLNRSEPALATAFRLHHGDMKRLRPLIEAYLLAGLDDDSLAGKVNVIPEAIRWFRLAFYDVAHQLCAPAYVRFHLIRAVDDEGETFLDNHRLWKLVGYTLGPDALDELLDHSAAGKEVFKVGGMAGWLIQQTRSVLQRKQFIAATNLSTEDQKNVAILLRMLLHELHGQEESDDQPFTELEQAVNAMLQELPWCKGAEFTPEPVREWDERAVELQSDELLLLAAGEKLPHLKELENLEIPLVPETKPNTQSNTSQAK